MRYIKSFIVLLALLLSASCRNASSNKVIVIQPLGDFSPSQSQVVYRQLISLNPGTVLRASIPIPSNAYYQLRNRYRADTIIHYLSLHTGIDTIIIGITNKDISTAKGNITDWGIMGLGYCPGNACVVSTFRLSKSALSTQFYKIVLHELGHTQGLPHCVNNTCFMRDAEGGNPTNEETGFCNSCRSYLERKGWKIN